MAQKIPLLGYCDKLSGRPGDVIAFKVSSHLAEDYEARLVRVISADPNPDGPGMIEEEVAADFAGRYPSRPQPFYPGSYVRIDHPLTLAGDPARGMTLEAVVWPTLVHGEEQVVLAVGEMVLLLLGDGSLGGRLGPHRFSSGVPLRLRHWYRIRFSYDPATKQVTLTQGATGPGGDLDGVVSRSAGASFDLGESAAVSIAALQVNGQASCYFNGKIEAPTVYGAAEPDD
ncbi:MAG: N,N-dimethylformamidase beta subunit family domain-containing protein, partial [Geminicoccaceae bacterium]